MFSGRFFSGDLIGGGGSSSLYCASLRMGVALGAALLGISLGCAGGLVTTRPVDDATSSAMEMEKDKEAMVGDALPLKATDEGVQARFQEPLDHLVQPLLQDHWVRGMAIGLIHPDGTAVFGYGTTGGHEGTVPGPDTVFEIGSITKVFTGLGLAQMVQQGTVDLHQAAAVMLAGDQETPAMALSLNGTEVTLEHLATHRSGLPRMPANFGPADLANPYDDYSPDQLTAYLHSHRLNAAPGLRAEYSNLGAGLLGYLLARKDGQSYEAWIASHIGGPLGMTDTVVSLRDHQKERLATGHDGEGKPRPLWDFTDAFAGAGALRSTMSDMLLFLRANMVPTDTPLAEALTLAQEPRADFDGNNKIGLGWLRSTAGVLWHNGQTGGYHSFMAFVPEEGVGVVILANSATPLVDQVGNAALRMARGKSYDPIQLPRFITLSSQALERYVGQYALAPEVILTVTLEGDGLHAQLTGQDAYTIKPLDETSFMYRVVPAKIVFQLDDDSQVTGLVLYQAGHKIPAQKLPY